MLSRLSPLCNSVYGPVDSTSLLSHYCPASRRYTRTPHALLVAARAEVARLAGVREQPVVAAHVAVDASKAVVGVTAFNEPVDHNSFHQALLGLAPRRNQRLLARGRTRSHASRRKQDDFLERYCSRAGTTGPL